MRRLIADLAPGVPPRYVSPASAICEAELQLAMTSSLDYAKSIGTVDDGRLRARCESLLAAAEARVKLQIEHGKFE